MKTLYEVRIGWKVYQCTGWKIDLENGWVELVRDRKVKFVKINKQTIVVPNLTEISGDS